MKAKRLLSWMAAASALSLTAGADAAIITLDLAGIGDEAVLEQFYNGGHDSVGNVGPNHHISFSDDAIGLVDRSFGGSAALSNAPSPGYAMTFEKSRGVINVPDGFSEGFAFYYAARQAGTASIHGGLDGTGPILGAWSLLVNNDSACSSLPVAAFCQWSMAGTAFAGVALSIQFDLLGSSIAFDDLTFGSSTAATPVRVGEPNGAPLLAFGLLVLVGCKAGKRGERSDRTLPHPSATDWSRVIP